MRAQEKRFLCCVSREMKMIAGQSMENRKSFRNVLAMVIWNHP